MSQRTVERGLDIEDAVDAGGLLGLAEAKGDVVDRISAHGEAIRSAEVDVAVNDEVGAVAVNNFGEARGSQIRKDFGSFAFHGAGDGRVVQDDDALIHTELRKCAFQLESFVNRGLNEGL